MKSYLKDMPPLPRRMLHLPTQDGYPVPWFVAATSPGVYDFRCVEHSKLAIAVKENRCWVCGQGMGTKYAFPIGPMCAVNRVIAEPPSHRECAEWSAKVCPFLTQRQLVRRETNLPEGYVHAAGIPILRQPGAVCIWLTRSYRPFQVPNGVLFALGEPTEVLWYREGRDATRAEVLESIESGYPELRKMAAIDGRKAIKELEEKMAIAMTLLPEE